MNEYIKRTGVKIIDKWHIDKLDLKDEEWQRLIRIAYTNVYFTDKNGNLWLTTFDRSILVKRHEKCEHKWIRCNDDLTCTCRDCGQELRNDLK